MGLLIALSVTAAASSPAAAGAVESAPAGASTHAASAQTGTEEVWERSFLEFLERLLQLLYRTHQPLPSDPDDAMRTARVTYESQPIAADLTQAEINEALVVISEVERLLDEAPAGLELPEAPQFFSVLTKMRTQLFEMSDGGFGSSDAATIDEERDHGR